MRVALAFACSVHLISSVAFAQTTPQVSTETATTRLLPVSGTLTDGRGRPITGEAVVTFSLYDASEGGVLLWTETQRVDSDAPRGRYTAYLGSAVPLPQSAFKEEQARWLETEIGGCALPRTMLVARPSAPRATDAEHLVVRPSPRSSSSRRLKGRRRRPLRRRSSTAVVSQVSSRNLPRQPMSGARSSPRRRPIASGSAPPILLKPVGSIEGDDLNTDGGTASAISNQAGTPRFALNINGDGSWITYDRATGTYQPGIAQRGGRVGVATTDHTAGGVVDSKLTVRNLYNNTGIWRDQRVECAAVCAQYAVDRRMDGI